MARWLRRAGVFGILGCALSLGLAAGRAMVGLPLQAMYRPPGISTFVLDWGHEERSGWLFRCGPLADCCSWTCVKPMITAADVDTDVWMTIAMRDRLADRGTATAVQAPEWANLPANFAGSEANDITNVFVTAYGWPARCLSARSAFGIDHEPSLSSNTILIESGPLLRVIPLRVHVGGLAANSAISASVLVAPWLLYRYLRGRLARDRTGLCTHCAYSRAGIAEGAKCPECGH